LQELPPGLKAITFGFAPERAVWPTVARSGPSGSRGLIHTPAGDMPFATTMVGRHNVANILAGVAGGLALGLPLEALERGIAAAAAAPGRLERVPDPGGRFIYVDFAHTPDALENVLQTLKTVGRGRLICVFGCGGDRDRTKRPLMGGIVARLSDLAVVTSDNPRTEDPTAIIADILPGLRAAKQRPARAPAAGAGFDAQGFAVEPDRRRAIALALAAAAPGDTVLIAGKGHETYQILGREKIHFDDREEAAAALARVAAPAAAATGARP
jgi:UDP-N-acetylmuramyl-tripeptide synthetase